MRPAALLLAMLGGCATVSPKQAAPAPRPYYYCSLQRSLAPGHISATIELDTDGAAASAYTLGWSPQGPNPLGVAVDWTAPGLTSPSDGATVRLFLNYLPQRRREQRLEYRLELRRIEAPGAHYGRIAFATPFMHGANVSPAIVRWGDLAAFAHGLPALHVVLADVVGREVARSRLDMAIFAALPAAIEELRPEVEAMLADHRNLCTLRDRNDEGGEIVVT